MYFNFIYVLLVHCTLQKPHEQLLALGRRRSSRGPIYTGFRRFPRKWLLFSVTFYAHCSWKNSGKIDNLMVVLVIYIFRCWLQL